MGANALETTRVAGRSTRRTVARAAGTGLVVLGLLTIAWCLTVWRWQDPATAVYTWWEQRELQSSYRDSAERFRKVTPRAPAAHRVPLVAVARRYRLGLRPEAPVGRLRVARLGLDDVVVNGTAASSLRKGPGRDARTFVPGEGQLVYIAGHRTTYGAPFAHIDSLRRGDDIAVEVPYGTFHYRVSHHTIVEADDLSVLKSHGRDEVALQACHPRFFATHRYIVWATLVRVEIAPRLGRSVALPKL